MSTKPSLHTIAIFVAGFMLVLPDRVAVASVTIDYTAQIGQQNVLDHTGSLIPDGWGEVRVGLIDSDFDIASHGNDLTRLREAWTQLGVTPIRDVLGEPSRFSDTTVIGQSGVGGKKLYLWVITTTNGGSVAQDFGNVHSHGLFSSSAANWTVPSEGQLPPGNSTLVNSSQVDQSLSGGAITAASLNLVQPGSFEIDYEVWQDTSFPSGTAAADRMPLADPDGDGIANLVEQFVGGNPVQEDQSPFDTRIENGHVVFEFDRSKDVPAGAASLYISTNLEEWAEVGSTAEASVTADLGDRERMVVKIPLHTLPNTWRAGLFVRLAVTL